MVLKIAGKDFKSINYLSEGKANVVYSVYWNEKEINKERVLRARKQCENYISTDLQFTLLHDQIIPILFQYNIDTQNLRDFELVECTEELLQKLQDVYLQFQSDTGREIIPGCSSGTIQIFNTQEKYLLMMPNYRHSNGVIVEFKPKWLTVPDMNEILAISGPKKFVPNLSKDGDIRACRTCALRRMRYSRHIRKHSICPLMLLLFRYLPSREQIDCCKTLLSLNSYKEDLTSVSNIVGKIVSFFDNSLMLLRMSKAQSQMSRLYDTYPLAMTLRDFTLILAFDEYTIKPNAYMIDFDIKHDKKRRYWDLIERKLWTEGWYFGRTNSSQKNDKCLLGNLMTIERVKSILESVSEEEYDV